MPEAGGHAGGTELGGDGNEQGADDPCRGAGEGGGRVSDKEGQERGPSS